MKFLAMHITNQKLRFDIFTVGHLQNIFMEHDLNILMIFGNFDSYNVLLSIATNIRVTYDCFSAPGTHISKKKSSIIENN